MKKIIVASLFFQTLFLFGVKKDERATIKGKFLSVCVYVKDKEGKKNKIRDAAHRTRTGEKRKGHKGYSKIVGDFLFKALQADSDEGIFENALLYFLARIKVSKLNSKKSINLLGNKDSGICKIITENWEPGTFDANKKSDEIEKVTCNGEVAFRLESDEKINEFVWECDGEAIEFRFEDEARVREAQVLPQSKTTYHEKQSQKVGNKKVQKQKKDSNRDTGDLVSLVLFGVPSDEQKEKASENNNQSDHEQEVSPPSPRRASVPLPPFFYKKYNFLLDNDVMESFDLDQNV